MKTKIIRYILFLSLVFCTFTLMLYILEHIGYKCFYLELFNIYCPGCGTTRMIKSIIELNLYQAFRYNPLMFVLSILFFIYFIVNSIRYFTNKKIIKIPMKIIIVLVVTLLIYGILRNIPGFDFLKPQEV